MKTKLFAGSAIATLVLAFGAIAAACGGGGDKLTLEEYFQELDRQINDLQQELDAIGAQFEGLTREEIEEQAPGGLRQQLEAMEALSGDVADLEAPAEVEEEHAAAIDAFDALIEISGGLLEQSESAPPDGDPFLIFEESAELAAAGQDLAEACLALEQVATDNDITVDLDCEER